MRFACTDCGDERDTRRPDLRCVLPGCAGFVLVLDSARWEASRAAQRSPAALAGVDVCPHGRAPEGCHACELHELTRTQLLAAVWVLAAACVVLGLCIAIHWGRL